MVVLLISGLTIFAQDGQKIAFGVQGGLNLQNMSAKDTDGNEVENSLLPGFHAGVNVIIPIAPDFYFQPVLQFSQKGTKTEESPEPVTFRVNYLELPLNLLYRGRLGQGYVLLGFGPYVGYGITGKATTGDEEMDIEFQNTIETGDPHSSAYMKALDAGAGIYAGYETALGLYFQLNTQYGLLNISPEDQRFSDDQSRANNVGFGLSLGYRF